MKRLVVLFLIVNFLSACQVKKDAKLVQETKVPKPKNIILMIGDGMGLAQLHATFVTQQDKMNIPRCKYIGLSNTRSIKDLITDSSASGTAMACGKKTKNGALGVDTTGAKITSILEIAEAHGLATGLVSTSAITHATPASFIAHNPSRNDYEGIAKDFLKTDIDVFIGGGLDHFDKRKDGLILTDSLKARGYDVLTSLEELYNYQNGKLAALVFEGHGPKVYEGRQGFLEAASIKAIEILNQDDDGFFLMIEGSQIDWGGHANDLKYVVEETIDFDDAVGKVLDFAQADGETLVIITADHETGGLSLTAGDLDGQNLMANFSTDHHSPIMVPIYSFGPGAENFIGFLENVQINHKMMEAFGF
jgi:alkaline phosphatase